MEAVCWMCQDTGDFGRFCPTPTTHRLFRAEYLRRRTQAGAAEGEIQAQTGRHPSQLAGTRVRAGEHSNQLEREEQAQAT